MVRIEVCFLLFVMSITSTIDSLTANDKKRINILLVTRDSSGSTFVGEMIQSWKYETFYTYEPLIAINWHHYMGPLNSDQVAFDLLNHIFHCNLPKNEMTERMYRMLYEHSFVNYNKFLAKDLDKRHLELNMYDDNVFWVTNKVCRESVVNLVKITRLRMYEVGKFMDQLDPITRNNLKVIFLYRDPRGVYSSRKRVGFCQYKCRDAKEICKDAELNLKDYQMVKKKYPKHVSIIRYEDISTDAMSFAKDFFPHSLNLTFNHRVQQFIASHTNSSKFQERRWTTIKKSDQLTFIWTKRLPVDVISSFDTFCKDAFNISGYKSYQEGVREGLKLDQINWTKDSMYIR